VASSSGSRRRLKGVAASNRGGRRRPKDAAASSDSRLRLKDAAASATHRVADCNATKGKRAAAFADTTKRAAMGRPLLRCSADHLLRQLLL
jgi:hypothetical protein